MPKIDPEKIKEVKSLLGEDGNTLIKDIPIYFDDRQYSLKLPKKVMDEFNINPKKDVFRMSIILPPYHTKEKPKLKLELVKK